MMSSTVAVLHAQKNENLKPVTIKSKIKSQTIVKDWLNGLLLGNDMSHLSYSYDNQLNELKSQYKSSKIVRGNNYQENFKKRYNQYVTDLTKLTKLEKKVAETKWENKVIYLKQSYELAKKAQAQLLEHLEKQQQFLLDKEAPEAKVALTEGLIQAAKNKLSDETHQLLGNGSVNNFKQLSDWQEFVLLQNIKQKAITQKENKSTVQKPHKILRNSSLPYSGRDYPAPVLNYTPEITPSYADENAQAGNPEDLSEDVIVQFSPAINQLAADLNNDYIKILNYVRQNIKLEYYAGAQKGADATLRSLAGNDVDQAALLIALLRRSNVPSRFVQGVIRQPIDEAMATVGLSNPNQVLLALNRAGIAHQAIVEGGQVVAIHRHYTWVDAYLPYANYRGSVADLSDKIWIPLAPAIKLDNMTDSDYNYQNSNLNSDTLVMDFLTTSTNISPLLFWKNQVQHDITNNYPNIIYEDLLNRQNYSTTQYQLLPSSLPFEVIATTAESPQLANAQIQSLTIQMGENSEYLDVTLLLPEIAGKRLTLSYSPASVDDLNIINQAGGIGLVEPYLIDLRPVIKVNGRQVEASNAPLPMASFSDLKLILNSPSGTEVFHRNTLIGNYLILTITPQSDNFVLDNEDPNLFADETRPTRLMHNLAKLYNQQWKQAEGEMAAVMDVALIKPIPAITIISPEYNLLQSQGLTTELQFKGISIDAISNSIDAISRGNIQQNQYDFYRLSSLQGSYLESRIFQSQWAVEAISADQGIRKLSNNNPILQLTPDNYQTQLLATNHPQYIKDEIETWLQHGNHAMLVENSDTIDTWSGSSWVVYNPASGYSGYFISGTYAGGQTTKSPNDWSHTGLYNELQNPYGEGANQDPLSASTIEIIQSSNYQFGVVNANLDKPLSVIVRDQYNNPVIGAEVTFQVKFGEAFLIDTTDSQKISPIKIRTNTDEFGLARVNLQSVEKINTHVLGLEKPTDLNISKWGYVSITASVKSFLGIINMDDYFELYAKPEVPFEIDVTSACESEPSEECLVKNGFFGVKGKNYHYRVIDIYGNFISNIPVNLSTQPQLYNQPGSNSSGNIGFGPHPYYNKGKIAMKYDNCLSSIDIVPPTCALQGIDAISDYYWTTFIPFHPVSESNTGSELFQLSLDSQNLPPITIEYNLSEQHYYNGVFQGQGYNFLKSNYYGPYGKYEAGSLGDTLRVPRKYLSHEINRHEDSLYSITGFFEKYASGMSGVTTGEGGTISGSLQVFSSLLMEFQTRDIDYNEMQLLQGYGRFTFDTVFRTCTTPGGNSSFFGIGEDACTFPDALGIREYDFNDSIFTAKVEISDIYPLADFIVESFTPSMVIEATITPESFRPENITIKIYKNDVLFQVNNQKYPDQNRFSVIFKPDNISTDIYLAEVIINQGNPFEMISPRVAVDGFQQKVVSSVTSEGIATLFSGQTGGGRVINGQVPSGLRKKTDVYLNDEYVCERGGFNFDLVTESNVKIDLQKYDEHGNLTTNLTTIADDTYPAGSNPVDVSIDVVKPGKYLVIINATSLVTGNSETIYGSFNSTLNNQDTLAIGHPIVKGIDLATGSMVYSKKQLSLSAPGNDLEFIHTYSDQSNQEIGPLGYGWSHNYMSRVIENDCDVITVTGTDGGTTRFRRQNGEINPMRGYHSTLIQNADGSYSFYSKNGTHYHYSKYQQNGWWNDAITDTNGNQLTISLENINEQAPIIKHVTDSTGRQLVFDYITRSFNCGDEGCDSTGRVLSKISAPQGTDINFTYSEMGQLISAQTCISGDCQLQESYGYFPTNNSDFIDYQSNLLAEVKDDLTQSARIYNYQDVVISYLLAGRPTATDVKQKQVTDIVETDGGNTTFSYSRTNHFNSQASVNQNGTITDYILNGYGAATSIAAANGTKTTVWEVSDEILLTSETDENGRTKTFEYDNNANLLQETIGSISRTYTYVTPKTQAPYFKDRIQSYTNWRGKTTTYQYDTNGNKIQESLDGITIEYSYTSTGQVSTIKDGRGGVQSLSYDSYGQLLSQDDAAGNSTQMTWDELGRKISETDANGSTTTFHYDAANRITSKSIDSRNWAYSYSQGGLVKIEIDPNGNTTGYTYDRMGRLLEIKNANDKTFSYVYDANGNKTQETDFNGNITTFVYDSANRLIKKTEPLGKITTYEYDNVGNVLTETTADRVASYTYDPKRYFLTSFTGDGASQGGGRTVTNAAITTRTVDGEGNILTEIDPNGNTTTFTYDAFNRVLTETGELGSGRSIIYDPNGNVLSETTNNSTGSQTRQFSYDGANRRKTAIDAEGNTTIYTVDGSGNVLSENMPQGKITSYGYNNLNLVTSKTQTGDTNATWSYQYDNSGNLTSETQPNGNIISTMYDPLNRPVSKTDTIGAISSFSYDSNSNIKSETDGNGNVTSYNYNALNQRTAATKPLARNHSYSYTPFGEMLTDTGPNGTITYTVNTLGQRTSAIGPDGYNEQYNYDSNDNLTSFTDSVGNQTTYGINALNQTTSQATGTFSKTLFYDLIGNKLTETDYKGILSAYTYDKENRQLNFTRAGQLQQTTVYYPAGLAATQTDANGHTRVHQYNSQYYRTQSNLPETQVIKYSVNGFGDITGIDNPGQNDLTRVLDKRRRLISETNGAGNQTQYEYDLNNNRTAEIKPDGTRWEFTYDAANRATSISNVVEGITTNYVYDNKDNLTSITDAENKTTTFTFDNRNRKLSKIYPDAKTVNYSYDANGNINTVDLPNGVTISYDYDVLNRKTSESYSGTYGSANVTFSLDANGNATTIAETIGALNFTTTQGFDSLDRMTSRDDVYGNNFIFSYDNNGNRTALKDHNNALTSYSYDGLNRLASLTHAGLGTFNWNYNSAGLTQSINYPNGASVQYQYGPANRIASIINKKSGADIASHTYQYDSNGNRTQMTESNIHINQVVNYTYDKADRLTSVEYPNNEKTQYILDKVGNRTSEIITGTSPNTKTYGYNNRDQLVSITDTLGSNTSYTFDDAGNQLSKDKNGVITTFDYTARHRVKSITIGTQPAINYQYDYTGQRVNYQRNGIEKRYLYDGLTLIAETNTIGNTLARYHYGDRYQLAEQRNSINSYYHVDSLGTNVAVTNQDGSIQARYEYDAYGNLLTQAGSSEQPFGFTGYQKDDDTGLYYANARYYDSETGTFLREDPLFGDIKTPPSLHRYQYAFNNPTAFIDPTGKGNDTAHYYDGLLIGNLIGLSEHESAAYALGAQIADEFQQTDAVETSLGQVRGDYWSKVRNNCGNHALCDVKPRVLRNAVANYVLNESHNYLEIGTADHAFTDSYFHIGKDEVHDLENQKLLTPIVGHLFEWKSTDKAYLYHNSKRVRAFRARAWLLYEHTVKQGTQKLDKGKFGLKLDEAVRALDIQHNKLTKRHSKLGYTDGGVYTWITDLSEITDQEEFNMVRDMLSGKGLGNIPKTEDHHLGKNVNALLNDYTVDQLIGIIMVTNRNLSEHVLKQYGKEDLIQYVNGKLFQAQAKSSDFIYTSVVREKNNKAERVKESNNAPGVKELSK